VSDGQILNLIEYVRKIVKNF